MHITYTVRVVKLEFNDSQLMRCNFEGALVATEKSLELMRLDHVGFLSLKVKGILYQ